MNRIVEDRLLLADCEAAVLVLRDILKHAGLKLGTKKADELLERFKKHREKFTRRVLDKREYIRKNEGKFSLIFRVSNRFRIGGSFPKKDDKDDEEKEKAKEYEKQIYSELVADGFYSSKTARMDVMRSLLYHYEGMLKNKEI